MGDVVVIFVTVVLSAFFSGMEIAFVSSNKLKIELDKKNGLAYARFFSKYVNQPEQFISAMLVGNNIVLVIYSIFMAGVLEPLIVNYIPGGAGGETVLMVYQTLLSTVLILIVAEFMPKVLFQLNPNNILRFFCYPAILGYYLLYPLVVITSWVSNQILYVLFGSSSAKNKYVFKKVDLENYLEEASVNGEHVVEPEVQIFQNAMEFPKIKLRECMIPRTEMEAVEVTESIDTLHDKFMETELSRILIYRDNIDNIIGYVHSHEMFKRPTHIGEVLISLPIVPETMPANKLLTIFIQQRKGIAVVVDEFGGTAGMVTMEDIIEEIFGEIEDEYDVDELTEKQLADHEYLFSARLEIDHLNNHYGLQLPESEDYETLGGLIVSHYQSIPRKDDEIVLGRFRFHIQEVSETHIDLVKVRLEED